MVMPIVVVHLGEYAPGYEVVGCEHGTHRRPYSISVVTRRTKMLLCRR